MNSVCGNVLGDFARSVLHHHRAVADPDHAIFGNEHGARIGSGHPSRCGRQHAPPRGWARLLDHLAAAGPSSIDDLRTELGLKRHELKSLRAPLERCGAIIARSLQVTAGDRHLHSSELAHWDQAFPGTGGTDLDPGHALKDLLAAGVRAAVVAPE